MTQFNDFCNFSGFLYSSAHGAGWDLEPMLLFFEACHVGYNSQKRVLFIYVNFNNQKWWIKPITRLVYFSEWHSCNLQANKLFNYVQSIYTAVRLLSLVCNTCFLQILEEYGKSWNIMWKFSRPWKALKMIIGIQKSGKIIENCNVDLENADVYHTVDYPCIC